MAAFLRSALFLASLLPLAACGTSPGCRAITGAFTSPNEVNAGPPPVCN